MKHWQKEEDGKLVLISNDIVVSERIWSISTIGRDVVFKEMCDEYFGMRLSKSEAIEALQEAIDWIKEQLEPL